MGMAKLNNEQWKEVLAKVKKGDQTISEIAKAYGVAAKSIYYRVEKSSDKDGSLLEINRLKREVKSLREALGYVTHELSKEKKVL